MQGEGLVNAKDAQGELHKCRSAHNGDMACAAGDGELGDNTPLCLVVGGHVVTGLGAMDVQMDDRHGHLGHSGVPVGGRHGLNHDAGHLRAHKVAQVMVLENAVVIGVGDEQSRNRACGPRYGRRWQFGARSRDRDGGGPGQRTWWCRLRADGHFGWAGSQGD